MNGNNQKRYNTVDLSVMMEIIQRSVIPLHGSLEQTMAAGTCITLKNPDHIRGSPKKQIDIMNPVAVDARVAALRCSL